MQLIHVAAGQRITGNTRVADIHCGEVIVVTLTEIRDSREEGEKLAERIRKVRRARVRREQRGKAGSFEKV